MQLSIKPVSFAIHILSLAILLMPISATPSRELGKTRGSHKNTMQNNIHKYSNPRLTYEIMVHGFLMWFAMGLLMPLGILMIRMSHREQCGRRLKILFYLHSISQVVAVLLVAVGAVMSVKYFNNSFNNHHQRIGVFLYAMVLLQVLIGIVRPHRGCKKRSLWFLAHWIIGTTVSLLGAINIYTGLQAYNEKTSRGIRTWIIIFTTELGLVVLVYMLQDKWVYIQRQGVILGNDPIIRPTRDQFIISQPDNKDKEVVNTCKL